jgi:hypothetical protein
MDSRLEFRFRPVQKGERVYYVPAQGSGNLQEFEPRPLEGAKESEPRPLEGAKESEPHPAWRGSGPSEKSSVAYARVEGPLAYARGSAERDSKLEVTVLFTTTSGTGVALESAAELAKDLQAIVQLVMLQVVPYPLRLESPPVPLQLTAQQLCNLAITTGIETEIVIILCRDKQQSLIQALKPQSVVVLGGSRRWWPSRERKLARTLRSQGHKVVLVNLK